MVGFPDTTLPNEVASGVSSLVSNLWILPPAGKNATIDRARITGERTGREATFVSDSRAPTSLGAVVTITSSVYVNCSFLVPCHIRRIARMPRNCILPHSPFLHVRFTWLSFSDKVRQ
jgi:hypothetical protein